MNKGYLFKKSWHTAKLSNQEKVWKAEQAADDEKKKLEDFRRELQEEREMERLRELQRDSTGAGGAEKLDWMYHAPIQAAGPSSEEYLLGKTFKEKAEDKETAQMQKVPGSIWLKNPLSSDQDMMVKIREDPLLAMKKEEQRQQQLVTQNPVRMQMLREQVIKQKLREEFEKEKKHKDKKEKKHKDKKDRKDRRDKKRSREEGADDLESSPKRVKLEPRKSDSAAPVEPGPSRDFDRREPSGDRHSRDHRSDDRDRHREERDIREHRGDRPDDRRHDDRDQRSNGRSEGRFEDRDRRDGRYDDRDRYRDSRDHRDYRDDRRDRYDGRDDLRDDRRPDDRHRPDDRDRRDSGGRYDGRARSEGGSSGTNGPVGERPAAGREPRANGHSAPAHGRRPEPKPRMTAEEREQKLREMQSNAVDHAENRWSRLTKDQEASARDKEQDQRDEAGTQLQAKFLNDMGQSVYSDKTTASLEDRLSRGKFYLQKTGGD